MADPKESNTETPNNSTDETFDELVDSITEGIINNIGKNSNKDNQPSAESTEKDDSEGIVKRIMDKTYGDSKKEDKEPAADKEDKPQPQEDFTGESRAYGVDMDLYGNRKKKESSTPTSSAGGIKAPKHPDAPKSGGGGKNVMDVFWNEFIVPAYTSCISGAVNVTMSFMDYVLFNAYVPQTPQKKKEEEEKNDIWSICSKVYEKYKRTAEKGMSVFSLAHQELMDNIEKAKSGLAPSWKVWPGKKAPMFFNEFVEISKKAEADPNSPEAEKWKKITSMPELMEGLFKKEILLRKLSISMAGMEVALAAETYKLPKEISKQLDEMQDLKGIQDEDKYKKEMKIRISTLKELIKEDTSINKELTKVLGEIEKDLDNPKKNQEDKVKSINNKLAIMKDIKPLVQEAEIDNKSQKYYEDISQNIEKIKTIYSGEPEKVTETIDNYLKSMKEATEPALASVDKYINASNLGRKIRATGKKINVAIKKFLDQDIPVEDLDERAIVNKMRESAEKSFKNSVASVSNFSVDDHEISWYDKADKSPKSPFSEKYGPFNIHKVVSGR